MEQRRWGARQRRPLLSVFLALFLWVCAVSAQLRYSISEELNEGTFIGNLAKDLGTDPASIKQRGFRIMSSSNERLFKVNENDGALYTNSKIDREEVCKESNACLINIKTVLDNPLEVHYISVEILDLNDHTPTFPGKTKRLEISESALPGATFQLQNAYDPDGGLNSVQQYKISQNDHFRLEVKDRGRDGKTPILQLQRQLDRESKRVHKLVLTAIDGGTPPKTGLVEILIEVLDVNDNMPVFTKDTYSATLQENAPVGTTVIQVNATDSDSGANGEVVYSFGSDVKDKIRQLFKMDSFTGEIIVTGNVDFEEQDSYDIDIQASDKGNIPLKTDKSVIIKIIDMNDNSPEIEVTSLSRAVSEDSRPGTTVALVSVIDLDSGLNGKIISHVSEESPFVLTASMQDNLFAVVTKAHLDREKKSAYDITIIAKDSGDPALTSKQIISIFVSDINDNSPEFLSSPYTFYISENNKPGDSMFSVKASDCDEGENAVIYYHILRNNKENAHTSFLNVNSETGEILALKSFDFETVKSFHFQVAATDGGSPPLSSNVTVNVFILDQNDNTPVILYPVSSNGSAEGVEEIPRNIKAGDLVTKVRAYDADIGYNGWLLFSLGQVTDHSIFSLDRYTGQIRTLRSLTETDEAEHRLLILVKDNGNVSLSATATVTVKLVEPKEAFAASDVKSAAKLDQEEDNVTFYLIITLGSVSLLFVISIIVLIAMQCSKSTEYTSKYLQDTNYDGTLCHSIQYRSGDKRYMLVGPRMSIGSTIVPGSQANTLVLPDRRHTSGEKGPVEGQEVGNGTDGGLHLCRYGDERGTSESIMAAPSGNRSIGRRPCR
ncbi:protocadherin alpha-8-like isoform X42 [Corythoichthys intestinalis]|uniref:protocadherin alpha-8-like isoform X42 n=1 Tax=Corythoichthys intestinalis TaxID=161448 RepID=UPI0025A64751|nr:protocadherin alpha-8-like isoform X42 [Corythoichthys intestinalis]